jgi:hypothetical protein
MRLPGTSFWLSSRVPGHLAMRLVLLGWGYERAVGGVGGCLRCLIPMAGLSARPRVGVVLVRHFRGGPRPRLGGLGLCIRCGSRRDGGRGMRAADSSSSNWRDQLVVLQELSVVQMRLLGENDGQEVKAWGRERRRCCWQDLGI